MTHIIRTKVIPVLVSIFLTVLVLSPVAKVNALFDNAKKEACSATSLNEATADCSKTAGDSVNGLLGAAINLFSLAIGVIAVIMLIIGGLKYITSQGDSNGIGSAKNTILYAVIGLVIVAFAQFIVRFVITKVKPK